MVAKLAGAAGAGEAENAGVANDSGDDPQLHAVVNGEGVPVILLHGLFGMGSNLGSIARALADRFCVHQLDLPNHGRSPWLEEGDVKSLAAAVLAYTRHAVDGPVCILGHSLGGKVAMQFALDNPEAVAALVVADIAPIAYPASHDAVFEGIEAVALAQPASRAEAGDILSQHVSEAGVRQFLLLSLQRSSRGSYSWRFNADGLREHYAALRAAPAGAPYPGPALFIYGAESSYMPPQGREAAGTLFPQAEFHEIAGTGHWLHAEKPDEFNREVRNFLLAGTAKTGDAA